MWLRRAGARALTPREVAKQTGAERESQETQEPVEDSGAIGRLEPRRLAPKDGELLGVHPYVDGGASSLCLPRCRDSRRAVLEDAKVDGGLEPAPLEEVHHLLDDPDRARVAVRCAGDLVHSRSLHDAGSLDSGRHGSPAIILSEQTCHLASGDERQERSHQHQHPTQPFRGQAFLLHW